MSDSPASKSRSLQFEQTHHAEKEGTPTVIATDGSTALNRRCHIGSAYLTDNGTWWAITRRWAYYSATLDLPLVAELYALRAAALRHPGVLLLTDSMRAIELIEDWRADRPRPIEGYGGYRLTSFLRFVSRHPEIAPLQHVRGHQGHPLNEGADLLAKLVRWSVPERMKRHEVRERAEFIVSRAVTRYVRENRNEEP